MPAVPVVASGQDGLFTRQQAVDAGWSSDRVRRRVASGRWRVVLGDVLGSADLELGQRQRHRAAVLASGGALSHLSAAEVWRLPVAVDASLHVTVPRNQHVRVPGVVAHRVRLPRSDLVDVAGIPVTSRERTLVDCLATLPYGSAEALLDRCLVRHWTELDVLARHVRRALGRRGSPQLVRLMREAARGTRSEAERVLARLLRSAGIRGWVAGMPMTLADGTHLELDLWFPVQRVVVEVDGKAWHVDDDRFQRDRVRQNALVTAGCTVLRFTWYDLTRAPRRVVATVRQALDLAMITGRGPKAATSGPTGP